MFYPNFREVRAVRLNEERHPTAQDIYDTHQYAVEKCCIIELQWFVPHYGLKKWVITPEDDVQELMNNLHVQTSML